MENDGKWCYYNVTNETTNETRTLELPIDMCFNAGHVLSIVTYSILMVISAIGNSTVLVILLSRRKNRSRINLMLMHLAMADLMVTFLMMPLEIGWAATVSWQAGDVMCRIMVFFRVYGLYLSSFVLVCISIDRYLAILKPMSLQGVGRRGKEMLLAAWMMSALCSTPQMFIFHLEKHPNLTSFEQCITFNTFPSPVHERSYDIFVVFMTYCLPLGVLIFCYGSILVEIRRRSKLTADGDKFRRSGLGFLGRAKIRTFKMTIVIVIVFFVCWTPYYVMCAWFWIDRHSAEKVDQIVQRGLFLFACTNSCMNPIVYGAFNIRARRTQGTARQNGASDARTNGTSVTAAGGHLPVNKAVWLVSWRKPSQESVHSNMSSNKSIRTNQTTTTTTTKRS